MLNGIALCWYLRELGVLFMWIPQVTADDLEYALVFLVPEHVHVYEIASSRLIIACGYSVGRGITLLQISVETDIIMWLMLFTMVPKQLPLIFWHLSDSFGLLLVDRYLCFVGSVDYK